MPKTEDRIIFRVSPHKATNEGPDDDFELYLWPCAEKRFRRAILTHRFAIANVNWPALEP